MITGGMGGLGEAICTKMLDGRLQGRDHAFARQHESQRMARRSMKAERLRISRLPVRRRRLRLVRGMRRARSQEVGPIDMLVNNAGITRDMTFKKMDKVNWDAVMQHQSRLRAST